jgi:hypothetical protein
MVVGEETDEEGRARPRAPAREAASKRADDGSKQRGAAWQARPPLNT